MAEEVRGSVANHRKGAPALPVLTDENTVSEDELDVPTRRKMSLKFGKIRTADTLVT